VPVFVHRADAAAIEKNNKVPKACIRAVDHDSVIELGKEQNPFTVNPVYYLRGVLL
jgi:hypothetical protein